MNDALFVTMCCGSEYKRLGRAHWVCGDCKEDRSLKYVMICDSMIKEDRKERWKTVAINSKEALEAKRKLGVIK